MKHLTIGVAMAATLLIVVPANAAAPSDGGASAAQNLEPEVTFEVTSEELVDLGTIAKQDGMTEDEAVAKWGWQQSFSDAVAALRLAYPEQFAGSGMNETTTIGGRISFVGEVPGDVQAYLSDVPVPVSLVPNAKISEVDLTAEVKSVHYAVQRQQLSKHVGTSYDEESGAVEVTLTGVSEKQRPAKLRSFAERAILSARRVEQGLPVAITVRPRASMGSETIRGGAILTVNDVLSCTSAWPVNSTITNSSGLITAEHCSNDMDYTQRNVLSYARSLANSKGDIQYHTSTEDVGHSFYFAVGEYRDIDSAGTPSNDQYLCVFGRKTGYHCDNVRDTYTCRDDYCNLVSMDDHNTDNGDSGAPWYYGSHPYGVHSGYHTTITGGHAQFTPLYNTMDDLSTRVRKGPS